MKTAYDELIKYLRPENIPDGFSEAYAKYTPDGREGIVLSEERLMGFLKPYEMPDDRREYLVDALKAIHGDNMAMEFSHFFIWLQCSKRYDNDLGGSTDITPHCLGIYDAAYPFLVNLACVPVAEKDLIRRGVPRELYSDIPHRMLREQMARYAQTGRIDVEDMPWKLNFYTLTIFLFDRFLFVPCVLDDPFRIYRSISGQVTGIPDAGLRVDAEGQVMPDEGTAPAEDPGSADTGYRYSRMKAFRQGGFITGRTENDKVITGNYMNPLGYIEDRTVTLDKTQYREVLRKGDWMIGFHIPEGEGYTPQHVRISMKLAWDFFAGYYPEFQMKGFWSASWLYDARLSVLLPADGRIVSVQRQFFDYSGGWNGEMAYYELFGENKAKLSEEGLTTGLQRRAAEFLRKGHRFCETGMVYLPEELEKDYESPIYATKEDIEDLEEMFRKNEIM